MKITDELIRPILEKELFDLCQKLFREKGILVSLSDFDFPSNDKEVTIKHIKKQIKILKDKLNVN